jgi:hypothetical protein
MMNPQKGKGTVRPDRSRSGYLCPWLKRSVRFGLRHNSPRPNLIGKLAEQNSEYCLTY